MAGAEPASAAQPEWELSKENFQPLKAGRKPGGLRGPSNDIKKLSTEEQRQAFLAELDGYKGDDPLEVWLRFIKWTQDTFKAGGHKAEMLPLLERCTRELQGIERYQYDIRYLRVWIQYADCLPDPTDVFSFLREHDVGQGHALFYIAHATYLELRGNYSAADNVYQRGIDRLAAPQDRLRAKFAEFQHRMARRIQRSAQELGQGQAEDSDAQERPTLAVLGGRRGGRTAGGLGPQKRKAAATPGRDNAPAGGGLHIFVDDEFAGPAASAPPALAAAVQPSSSTGAGPSWAHLPSFEAGRKENTQKASSWAGQRIKQKPAHSAPVAAPLSIPMDPEFEAKQEKADARRRAALAAPHTSLRQRLERSAHGPEGTAMLEEQLVSDPLRLHRAPPPAAAAPPPIVATRREEVLCCDVAVLRGADGQERCFEELRGDKWLERRAQPGTQPVGSDAAAPALAQQDSHATPQLAQHESQPLAARCVPGSLAPSPRPPLVDEAPAHAPDRPVAEQQCPAAEPPGTTYGGQAKLSPFSQPAPEPLPASEPAPASSHVPEPPGEALAALNTALQDMAASSSDVTMSTRSAFEAINAMFGQRLPPGGVGAAAYRDQGPGDEPADPTMTLSTRDAFAAINSMFGGPAAAAAPMLPPASDPTVTLSTRAAFEALNAVFAAGAGRAGVAVSEAGEGRAARFGLAPASGPAAAGAAFTIEPAHAFSRGQDGEDGGLGIRQDTVFMLRLTDPLAPGRPASGPPGLGVREDTVFVGLPAAGDAFSAEPGGLDIREDTVFLGSVSAAFGAAGAQSPALGLAVREDTQYIFPLAVAAGGAAGSEGSPARGDDDTSDLLADSESTLAGGGAAFASKWGFDPGANDTLDFAGHGGLPNPQALQPLYETLDISAQALQPPLDDTLDIGDQALQPLLDETLDIGAQALQPLDDTPGGGSESTGPLASQGVDAPEVSTGLTHGLGALDLAAGRQAVPMFDPGEVNQPPSHVSEGSRDADFNDENRAVGAAAAPAVLHRDIRHASVAALALRPLGQARAAELGIDVEADEEAEVALAAAPWDCEGPNGSPRAGTPVQDDFQVFADESDGVDAEGLEPTLQLTAAASPGTPRCVNPFALGFQEHMLGMLDPPVAQWKGVSVVSAAEEAAATAAFAAVRGGAACSVQLGGRAFQVQRCIGAGTYATVYQAAAGSDGADVALKLESPPCPWEWYVCRAVQGRVPPAMRPSFMDPSALLLGPGASVLAMPRGSHGSLQDLLNLYLRRGQRPEEAVVMHLAAALLRTLGALHAARVLHNDVKPDNLLVTLAGPGQGGGGDENAAPAVGLQLIDFGRGVDLELLPPGARLQGDCGTDAFRCVEMREGREWVWQADAYGAAGCVHCLLFGGYMEVEKVIDGATGAVAVRIKAPLRRYWARDIWEEFFSVLLNYSDAGAPPPWAALASRFEAHLAGDRDARRALRAELGKLAADLSAPR